MTLDETDCGESLLRERQMGREWGASELGALIRERLAPIAENLAAPSLLALLADLGDPVQMLQDAEEDRSREEWERGVALGIYPSEAEIAAATAANLPLPDDPPF